MWQEIATYTTLLIVVTTVIWRLFRRQHHTHSTDAGCEDCPISEQCSHTDCHIAGHNKDCCHSA